MDSSTELNILTFVRGTDSFLKEASWSLKGSPTALAHLNAGNKTGRILESVLPHSFWVSFSRFRVPKMALYFLSF